MLVNEQIITEEEVLPYEVVSSVAIPNDALSDFDTAPVVIYPYEDKDGEGIVAIGPRGQEARPWEKGWKGYGELRVRADVDPRDAIKGHFEDLGYLGLIHTIPLTHYEWGPNGLCRPMNGTVELNQRRMHQR